MFIMVYGTIFGFIILGDKMEKNCPIIFNGLEYMAKSPGFYLR